MSRPSVNIIGLKASILKMEGDLVYDYNPLKVLRINDPNNSYFLFIPLEDEFGNNLKNILDIVNNNIYILSNTGKYDLVDFSNNKYYLCGEEVSIDYLKKNYINTNNKFYCYKKSNDSILQNQIINLDTNLLNFSITRPLLIDAQEAYDGSVNLIINDGYTYPKLINTRFTVIGNNKYKIIDRDGEDDSNIYNLNSFNTDVSLQKITNDIVNIRFDGVHTNGNLPVGNYVFYFKLADDDDNTTDFIGESSIVTCHKGNLNDPFSIEGGVEDQNSYKQVHFTLTNIDASYNKVIVYYSRQTSTITGVSQTKYKKILQKYDVVNNKAVIHISGFEDTDDSTSQEINALYQIIGSAKAQAIQLNMLFLGNLKSPDINYKALKNLALHFYPTITTKSIGLVDNDYNLTKGEEGTYSGEYYNTDNIYYYTGYWNDEIYRLGIVFILNDNSLSPVFNIRGKVNISNDTNVQKIKLLSTTTTAVEAESENNEVDKILDSQNPEEILDYIYEVPFDIENNIIESDAYFNSESITDENVKGVFKITYKNTLLTSTDSYALGIKLNVDNNKVLDILKRYTKGFFLVRLKRLATTLCQAITIGYDRVSHLPLLPVLEGYITESFLTNGLLLDHNFNNRIITGNTGIKALAAISPEYEVRLNYFDTLFTSTNYYAELAYEQYALKFLLRSGAHLYPSNTYETINNNTFIRDLGNVYIQAVPDGTPAIRNKNYVYSSKAGEEATAYRFSSIFIKSKAETNSSITRGNWGAYLGFELLRKGLVENLQRINIKIPNYNSNNLLDYFTLRYLDLTPYYSIMPRTSWFDYEKNGYDAFRGDCYICNFTHRMNRNFQDPSFPINDEILDESTWKDHYKRKSPGKSSSGDHTITFNIKDDGSVTANPDTGIDIVEREKINRGDVNAVKMGHWVTFKVMTTHNLSMRSIDESIATEVATNHKGRTFYPLYPMSSEGTNKTPDSYLMNEGYGKTTSEKNNFIRSDVPYEKNIYNTRIAYSDINSTISISNNFRVFRLGHYRDYSNQYGELVKLVPFGSNLICVMEHGIGIVSVNEKAIAAESQTGVAYITSNNVLPEKMTILSDMFGSLWPESVILTPTAIYGVDTVAKKIWKCNGESVQVISDFTIQKFLNDNISLKEYETIPIVGIRNVKTHYNAFKKDVMFTFYDDLNSIEEKCWNICYNEESPGKFVTFYSWIPSYSANIDNIYFSFDRLASKDLAFLFDYNGDILLGDGTDDSHILNSDGTLEQEIKFLDSDYYEMEINHKYRSSKIYKLCIDDSEEEASITYSYNNLNLSKIYKLKVLGTPSEIERIPIKILKYVKDDNNNFIASGFVETTVVVCTKEYRNKLLNYFWKHGQAGLMNLDIPIKVTNWYGRLHPFEFEFVVNEDLLVHKIFDNLLIVSNKALPDSIHYEISGEVYNFSNDKENMYYRQEATKLFYQYNGYDLSYDYDYLKLHPKHRYDNYHKYFDKSTIFPLRVSKKDGLNEIYDTYLRLTSSIMDYQSLAGSEISWDKTQNNFNIVTHLKIYPLDGYEEINISENDYNELYNKTGVKVRKDTINGVTNFYKLVPYGRRLGNSLYQEDRWLVQIPQINYAEFNESEWYNEVPPLNIYYQKLPEEETKYTLLYNALNEYASFPPTKYFINNNGEVEYKYDNILNQLLNTSLSWGSLKQTRIRDKYLKIKVRYTGKDLAIIQAIITSYTQSFA